MSADVLSELKLRERATVTLLRSTPTPEVPPEASRFLGDNAGRRRGVGEPDRKPSRSTLAPARQNFETKSLPSPLSHALPQGLFVRVILAISGD